MRKKWLKRILYIFGTLIALLLILWGVLYWYVSAHKQELITKLEQAIGDKIEGKLTIEDIRPDVFKTFPNMAIRLDGLSLVDSLYEQHHRKLLDLKHAYVRINIFSVIFGKPKISKIILEEGLLHLFIDENGYSNNYLLKSKQKNPEQKKKKVDIEHIELDGVAFLIDNKPMNKRFNVRFNNVSAKIYTVDSILKVRADVNALVGQLGFKLSKGSFLKNAAIKGAINFDYNTKSKIGNVLENDLDIDNEKLKLKAQFDMGKPKALPFEIYLTGKKITYNVAVKWLSENIFNKLSKFDFNKNLSVAALIKGDMLERGTNPYIGIDFATEHNTVSLLGSTFTEVYFKGKFVNQLEPDQPKHDSNSVIVIDSLSALYNGLPVCARDISIVNFIHPYVVAYLKAQFDATVLNNTFGEQFNFTKGTCSYDLKYNGNLFANSLIADEIYGNVTIQNFDFIYNERNLKFHNGTAQLAFNGPDLLLNKLQIFAQNSDININGVSHDFLKTFVEIPGKASMDLHLQSNNIDLGAFMTYFVQKRSTSKKGKQFAADRLDDFLTNSDIAIDMRINKALYKKFVATNVVSNMSFTTAGLAIHNLSLNHAQGTINLKANIDQQSQNNPFNLNFNVANVKVNQLFYALNNFGFKNLTDKNVAGNISINGNLSGNVTDKGALMTNRLNGGMKYNLNNAALRNFELFAKVQKWFKNRGLDNIEIDKFAGDISLKNGNIIIPPTKLETSALNLSFQGVYGLVPGAATNIDFRVPLRNPQIDKDRVERGLKKRKGEGLVLNLNAHSDASGKISIGVGKVNGKDDGKVVDEEEE
ncbi:hypothetical protein DBR32_06495 [Taibaiella sp. KBW10]|uniref:AsmA family protein n=1 Tax=Taibaiella sp. KBW10 TaxID=2153357 RepID=UPI000F5B08F0|nr:AsmA-like C-terminal region-containing protein [Taibaiella sp. KBW10]RQO31599.1 hypothetical protein DBR32_06495 [Taibaiella sp. KBW10]